MFFSALSWFVHPESFSSDLFFPENKLNFTTCVSNQETIEGSSFKSHLNVGQKCCRGCCYKTFFFAQGKLARLFLSGTPSKMFLEQDCLLLASLNKLDCFFQPSLIFQSKTVCPSHPDKLMLSGLQTSQTAFLLQAQFDVLE